MNIVFFKMAFRNIIRNKFNSLINISGFSIGIATILFIFLFVKTETTFDNFHPDRKRLYRVIETYDSKGGHTVMGFTRYPEAPAIAKSIPGIDDYCRISSGNKVKCYRGKELHKINNLRFADDNFFTFFSFHLLSGNQLTALNSAEKIVLSKNLSTQIFGKTDPLGQNMVWNQKVFTVSGISENPPVNTHLQFDAIISIKYMEGDKENYWLGWGGGPEFLSYLKLSEGVTASQIEAGLPQLFYENINKGMESIGFKISANLQNITKVHVSTGKIVYDCRDNRSRNSIMIITFIGLLILTLAIANYISLYVAQKSDKLKDICLLSVHGATRFQLIFQAYAEVLAVSFISSLSGLYMFSILTPILNRYLNTSVSLESHLLTSLIFIAALIIILSFIIVLLSTNWVFRFRLADALKGKIRLSGSNVRIDTLLITFQFTIVVILIVSVLVIERQNKYMLNKDYGFTKENILSIFPDKEFKHNELSQFKQELIKMPEVANVSLSSESVGSGLTLNGYKITGETEVTMLSVIYTDPGFLECFGINLMSGRNFKEGTTQDNNSILVNEKLVKRAGWKEPLNMTIDRNGLMTVIGVVNNFNFAPLNSEIEPLIIMCNPAYDGWGYNCINIRYNTKDIQSFAVKLSRMWERNYPGIPYEISFLDDQLAKNYESVILQQKLVTFFSFLAIVIACLGLFGLTTFLAQRKTKEIGIRKINGARVPEVIFMLNREFIRWIIISFAVGCPAAWYAMHRFLLNFAFRTDLSWWIFASAGLLTLAIALLTVSWQSWMAATRNPVEALRYE
jgi:putative ABC transport system permease protein